MPQKGIKSGGFASLFNMWHTAPRHLRQQMLSPHSIRLFVIRKSLKAVNGPEGEKAGHGGTEQPINVSHQLAKEEVAAGGTSERIYRNVMTLRGRVGQKGAMLGGIHFCWMCNMPNWKILTSALRWQSGSFQSQPVSTLCRAAVQPALVYKTQSPLPVVKLVYLGQVAKQHVSLVLQRGGDEVAELWIIQFCKIALQRRKEHGRKRRKETERGRIVRRR